VGTFLGNETRNFYGNNAPEKLDTFWRFYLGTGNSPAYGGDKIWPGAGWTGMPLIIKEKGRTYIIQGCFDYRLKKFDAENGNLIWEYKFDDILKATGTFWINYNAHTKEDRYVIIQGSRKGYLKTKDSLYCTSLRAVSFITGKELWRMNSVATDCYSRDVDGSALVINDTAFLALENGLFTVFNPDYKYSEIKDGLLQPKIYQQLKYYNDEDIKLHGDDLVAEASPTLLNNHIYTPSGTGWIYGYNLATGKNDWEFYIGCDINGSMPVTEDNCLLVPVEKQYIPGRGGVLKINPALSPDKCVQWFFPVDTLHWSHWEGGLIGSVTVNDNYEKFGNYNMAVFNDVKGFLYVVDYMNLEPGKMELGPDNKTYYPVPKLLIKQKTDVTIATPLIIDDKIIAPTDKGLFLYKIIDNKGKPELLLLDEAKNMQLDATPSVYNGRIYIAAWDGYLYCLGNRSSK